MSALILSIYYSHYHAVTSPLLLSSEQRSEEKEDSMSMEEKRREGTERTGREEIIGYDGHVCDYNMSMCVSVRVCMHRRTCLYV